MRQLILCLFTLTLIACGGGGSGNSSAPPSSTTPPPTVTPPPAIPSPPVANAVASVTNGPAPLSVTFNASTSSDPQKLALSYSWDFGDGATGSGVTSTHAYTVPGTYSAKVTAGNGTNSSTSTPITITVEQPPGPNPSFTYTLNSLTVNFDASGTTNPSGKPLTYTWDFGDGNTGSGVKPTHVYQSASYYTVSLTVSDGIGTGTLQMSLITTAPTVGGIWKGTNTLPNGDTVVWFALINEEGIFYASATEQTTGCTILYSGDMTTPPTQLNFAGTIISTSPNCTYADGSNSAQGKIFGIVVADKTINLTLDVHTLNDQTELTATFTGDFNDLYNQPKQLKDIEGNYTDPKTGLVFTIGPSTDSFYDAVTTQDSTTGCVLNGRVFADGTHNVFSVDGNLTGCQGQYANLIGSNGSGLFTLDTTQSPVALVGGVDAYLNSQHYVIIFDFPKIQ